MATNANEILDRLAALLEEERASRCSEMDEDVSFALRNAAPALIRLARAVLDVDDWCDKDDYTIKLDHDERAAALKALGEVRL